MTQTFDIATVRQDVENLYYISLFYALKTRHL